MCAGDVEREDLKEEARKILSAAVRTGERFGADHDRGWWLDLARSLEAAGCLMRGEGRTAGYWLSARGRLLLQGKENFLGTKSSGRSAPKQ